MFTANTKDLEKLEDDLGKLYKKAVPFAHKEMLNATAKAGKKVYKRIAKAKMTLRNKWIINSIRSANATTSTQEALLGSIAEPMEKQEFGGVKSKRGKEGVAITTPYASGEGLKASPRKRVARRPNQLKNIKLTRTKSNNNVARIKEAQRSGKNFLYLAFGRKKGIFRILKTRIRMVQDLTAKAVTIPRNPMLKPAVDRITPLMQPLYKQAMEREIVKQRIFMSR